MKIPYRTIAFLLLLLGIVLLAGGCSTNESTGANVYVTAYHGYGYGPGWGYSWYPTHPGPGVDRPTMGPPSTVDLPPVPWESDDE